MAKVKRGRQKKRLVLDLGSSAIRLCELKKTKTGYQLSRYFQREYSADPAIDEDTRKRIRQQALIDLMKEAKLRKQKVIFAVPGQSVFTRSRALPPVPEFKVTQIVKYEIQQQIPFSLDQIAMDYQILSRTEAGGYDVMMAAIKVDVVEKHMDVLAGAKLSLDTVDVSPIAAYNWLKHTGEFGEQGECVALIDIGAATTDIVIERDNQFRFTRPLNIGGNDLTLAIASSFGMNYDEAEKVKRQRAYAPTGDPQKDGKAGEVVGKVLQRLVNEVMRSFAYFRSLPGGGTVNRVILCGGGACLRNIVPYMQGQLGVEVRIAQPLAGLAIGPAAQQASEAPEQSPVVLGLALRCNEAVPIEINLIPPRVLELARQREQLWYYSLSMATAALILASIIPVSEQKNRLVQEKIETLRRNIQMYDPLLANQLDQNPNALSTARQELDAAWAQIRAAQTDIQQLDTARQNSNSWLIEFTLLNDARPSGNKMWFDRLESTTIDPKLAPNAERPGGRGGAGGAGGAAARQGGGRGERGATGANRFSPGMPEITPRAVATERGGRPRGPGRGNQPGVELPEPNGVKVHGFATGPEVIQEFVSNLKGSERRMADGSAVRVVEAYFNDAQVKAYPLGTLYNTNDRSNSDIDMTMTNPADIVYEFEVDVIIETARQFGGAAVTGPTPAGPAPAGAAPGGAVDPAASGQPLTLPPRNPDAEGAPQ